MELWGTQSPLPGNASAGPPNEISLGDELARIWLFVPRRVLRIGYFTSLTAVVNSRDIPGLWTRTRVTVYGHGSGAGRPGTLLCTGPVWNTFSKKWFGSSPLVALIWTLLHRVCESHPLEPSLSRHRISHDALVFACGRYYGPICKNLRVGDPARLSANGCHPSY